MKIATPFVRATAVRRPLMRPQQTRRGDDLDRASIVEFEREGMGVAPKE